MRCGCELGLNHEGHYINTSKCCVERLQKELHDQTIFNQRFADKLQEFGTIDNLIEAYRKAKMEARKNATP